MDKVKTIIGKEWAEVFKNRLVLFTVIFLPLIFVALPIITLGMMSGIEGGEINNGGDALPVAEALCEGLSETECLQVYMIDIFSLLFMILPVSIPVTIAAYSIVGEKTTRSLEPLLATPITTSELLIGKILASSIPAVLATWIAYTLYAVSVRILIGAEAGARVVSSTWLVAVFIVGPLLTLFSVCIAIMISSRVTDPRVAEQLSAVVILPIILILVGQSVGFLIINNQLVFIAAIALLILDSILLYFTIKLFQRETILTAWK